MRVLIASLNSAVERLLVVSEHRPGTVHRLVGGDTLAGGKGVNVARVLAQLTRSGALAGTPDTAPVPLLVGYSGGATGRLFEELLDAEGLAAALVPTAGATRICEVLVDQSDPEGATVYNAPGPRIAAPERDRLDEAFERLLADTAALVCTGSMPPGVPHDQYARWITQARQHGVLTVLDAHGEALAAGAGAVPDVVKVNLDELSDVADGGDPFATAHTWLTAGVRLVVVTDGARPARALTTEGAFEVTAPQVAVRSAVGSGDAFCAGLVGSLLADPAAGWEAHLHMAAACGASNAASVTAGLSPDPSPVSLLPQVTVCRSMPGQSPSRGTGS